MATPPVIAIDTKEFAKFYSELKSAFGKYVCAASVMGMWANTKGEGLFTRAGANTYKGMIKKSMDGDLNLAHWPPLKDTTIDLKAADAGYRSTWKYSGAVYRNIIARKRGKGYEVGLKKNAPAVPMTGFRATAKSPRTKGRKINIHEYVTWMEYGTDWMDARPLFGPALIHFSSTFGPFLQTVVARSVYSVNRLYKIKKGGSKYSSGDVLGGGLGQASMEAATGGGEFSAQVIGEILVKSASPEGGDINLTPYTGKTGMTTTQNIKKTARQNLTLGMQNMAKADSSEAKRWLDALPDDIANEFSEDFGGHIT